MRPAKPSAKPRCVFDAETTLCDGVKYSAAPLEVELTTEICGLRADLGLKAHVKHAVSFVKYEEGGPMQHAGLHFDQVDQAAWSADGGLQAHLNL